MPRIFKPVQTHISVFNHLQTSADGSSAVSAHTAVTQNNGPVGSRAGVQGFDLIVKGILGPIPGARPSNARNQPTCLRCLLTGHVRVACTNRIRCWACKAWGHIGASCPVIAQKYPAPNPRVNFGQQNKQMVNQQSISAPFRPSNLELGLPINPSATLQTPYTTAPRSSQVTPPPPPPPRPKTSDLAAIRSTDTAAMANFPFDPLRFIPAGHQSIQVEGRQARVRVVCGHIHRKNENLAMVMIIPMPLGEVHFANVREILSEFLTTHNRLGFQKISKCPLGQAFVQLHSVFDRDKLVMQIPHRFDDVHIIFEKHDEGMNLRRFQLNRECWIFIVGFHADLRNFADIRNAVKSFSTFMEWDHQLSTDAGILVKIRVEELRHIPSSILLRGTNEFRGDSWSCPISILQQRLIEEGPADEEPDPQEGNSHPVPQQPHFHPNQHHFFGSINQHQQEENNEHVHQAEEQNIHNQVNLDMNLVNVPLHLAQGFHPWGPQGNIDLNVDLELHQGEFLEIQDLMEPLADMQQLQAELPIMDDNSNITISVGSNDSEATWNNLSNG